MGVEMKVKNGTDSSKLDDWDGIGETTEPNCNDVMQIFIKVKREVITKISYTITSSACAAVKDCAAAAADLAEGKAVMEAYLIDTKDISEYVGGLSEGSMHCALMAELTLKKALADYARNRCRGVLVF